MNVVYTPLAVRQIENLHLIVSHRASLGIADSYIARIVRHCGKLATFPERGTKRDDLLPGLRTIGFEHRITIALVVQPETVLMEGVFYGGQDFEREFKS